MTEVVILFSINPLRATGLFLYFMKTSENVYRAR